MKTIDEQLKEVNNEPLSSVQTVEEYNQLAKTLTESINKLKEVVMEIYERQNIQDKVLEQAVKERR